MPVAPGGWASHFSQNLDETIWKPPWITAFLHLLVQVSAFISRSWMQEKKIFCVSVCTFKHSMNTLTSKETGLSLGHQ